MPIKPKVIPFEGQQIVPVETYLHLSGSVRSTSLSFQQRSNLSPARSSSIRTSLANYASPTAEIAAAASSIKASRSRTPRQRHHIAGSVFGKTVNSRPVYGCEFVIRWNGYNKLVNKNIKPRNRSTRRRTQHVVQITREITFGIVLNWNVPNQCIFVTFFLEGK